MRVQIVVTGRVQGVGFRHFTATRARVLGITGTARNLPNGQVEIIAEGERPALDTLVDAVRGGPPGANVRDIRLDWQDGPPRAREFVIR